MTARRDRTLWGQRDFMALWASLSVSEAGSQISQLALPLAALSTLRSGSVGVGLLRALETLPFLVIGLPAGAWIERRRRRPVMLASDGVRLLALGSIPLAYTLGWLTLVQLYVVALVAGVGTVLFDVAYQSYLPQIVRREDLLAGNAKLGLSQSVAQVGGPGIAGVLIRVLGAPVAVAVDAASFAVSALCVTAVRSREPDPRPRQTGSTLAAEARAGLHYVLGHPVLKHLAGATATANLALAAIDTVLLVFLAHDVHLGAGRIGLVLLLGGTGVVAGAPTGGTLGRRFGIGAACVVGLAVAGAGSVLAPLAPARASGMWLVVASQWLVMFGGTVYNVNQVALRQAVCPEALRSRMTATMRFMVFGTIPIGDVVGGELGAQIGLRPALWVASCIAAAAVAWVLPAPVRRLRDLPGEDSAQCSDQPAPARR